MSAVADSPAVAVVRAHMEAYSNQDLGTARGNVAEEVQCFTNDVNLAGIEAYMEGLTQFAAMLAPGSLNIIATRGDDRKAMIMAEHTVGGQRFPSARTFELDETGKIKVERVVFFDPQSA